LCNQKLIVFSARRIKHRECMWEQKVHLWDIFSPPHARILLFLAAGAFLGARKVPFRTSHIIHIMNSVTCWSALWNFTWRAHVVRILRESLGNKLTLCGDANECLCATQISPSSASTIRSILATRLLTEKSLRRAIIIWERISVMEASAALSAPNTCPGSAHWKVMALLNGWNARPSTTCWICTTRFFISLCKPLIIVYERSQAVNGARAHMMTKKNAGSVSDIFTNLALLFVWWEQVLKITQNHDFLTQYSSRAPNASYN
jgi:hypothetical protein